MLTIRDREISGTADDLHDLATLLSTVPPGESVTRGPIRVTTLPGALVTIGIGETAEFAGGREHLLRLALNIRGMADMTDGGHMHVEPYPDHPFLADDSDWLVVVSPHGGMPRHPAPAPVPGESGARADHPSLCLVCGLDYGSRPPAAWPWGPAGTDPGHGFCACCGIEFGHQDATLAGCRRARSRWAEAGHQWADSSARPSSWDLATQLAALPVRAR